MGKLVFAIAFASAIPVGHAMIPFHAMFLQHATCNMQHAK